MLLNYSILFLSSADPSLGRPNIARIPDQVRMDFLMEGMGFDKEHLKDKERSNFDTSVLL